MRGLKFRSFDEELNQFCYFDLLGEFDDHAYYLLGNKNVEQFAGLTDKNGVEIFEGDIVDSIGYRGEVIFEDCSFNVDGFYYSSMDYPTMAFSENVEFEVIGNIHQHPELLS